MTSFASLMALSASHTRESQQAVETALQERRRKEAAQRRQQEEKEAREREQEKKMRMRRLEEEKRAQERELRLAEERRAREAALQRREDAQRDSLRYGPKKAGKTAAGGAGGASSKWPASSSDARDAVRRRRMPDDDEPDAGPVLTREELRERKQQAEMRRLFSVSKRLAAPVRTHGKTGMRLPGGAMNIVTNRSGQAAADEAASSGGGSVKDRLAAKPNTLVQLNMKKRDKRTEDEIQMEVRANRKVLDGSEALQFTDWFSDKKKDKPSAKASPAPGVSSSSPPSRADTPASRPSASTSAASSQRADPRSSKPAPSKYAPSSLNKSTSGLPRASPSDAHPVSGKFPKINKSSSGASSSQRPAPSSSSTSQKQYKRPRSPSLSDSPPPPPAKKRASHYADPANMDISQEIWKMFGKDRHSYVSRDVFSDDEDMEADATALEREEKMSARIAKREEMLAIEDERRHEEEKRQRRKEKERAMGRGR